jgi:hypothetical protein
MQTFRQLHKDRNAPQGAASIAGLLITAEAMIADRPKKEAPHAPMPGDGMGGMDYSLRSDKNGRSRRSFYDGPGARRAT